MLRSPEALSSWKAAPFYYLIERINKIKNFKTTECACEICIQMCKDRPCWGTPEDVQKIIDAGYQDRLMKDWWVAEPNILILSPAIVGYEGKCAPSWPEGKCTFLSESNMCEIHELKPLEGRVAIHSGSEDNMHKVTAMTWDNEESQNFVNSVIKW
jgi:hypothetical protein